MDKLKITQEIAAVLLSLLGGLVNFLISDKHTIGSFITSMVVAGFAGWITVLLCKEVGFSDNLIGVFGGMSGYSGISFLELYKRKILNKINKKL